MLPLWAWAEIIDREADLHDDPDKVEQLTGAANRMRCLGDALDLAFVGGPVPEFDPADFETALACITAQMPLLQPSDRVERTLITHAKMGLLLAPLAIKQGRFSPHVAAPQSIPAHPT